MRNVLCLKWGKLYGSDNWVEWRKRLFRKVPEIGNSSCFRFVIALYGNPNPLEAINGFSGVKDGRRSLHRMCRPTPWVKDLWEE